jgi:hypothetical protein
MRSHVWLLTGILLTAGCQAKLDIAKSYAVQQGETKFILIDAPMGEQKIKVAVGSGGVPVNLHVIAGATQEQAEKAIQEKKGILASKTNTPDPTVEATIPAKQGYVVTVECPDKPANVKIHITSR